eukprot:5927762-Pyramimonas_sp.AAC.1
MTGPAVCLRAWAGRGLRAPPKAPSGADGEKGPSLPQGWHPGTKSQNPSYIHGTSGHWCGRIRFHQ